MKDQNGISLYDKGESIPVPPGLPADFSIVSRFGFKVVEIENKLYWEAATETDYRQSEAQRLGITPDQVTVSGEPTSCRSIGLNCFGACSFYSCQPGFNKARRHFYCTCR
jgi:hypothetical protein